MTEEAQNQTDSEPAPENVAEEDVAMGPVTDDEVEVTALDALEADEAGEEAPPAPRPKKSKTKQGGNGKEDDDEIIEAEMLGRDESRQVVHALLFIADKPLSAERIAETLGDMDCDIVRNLLVELGEEIEASDAPYELREIAGGYQLATKSQFAPYLRRLLQIKKRNRLSKAVLETLAIIAYKQPCTRADVESIRGVSVSHSFEVLQEKGLIKIIGTAELPGRPRLYRTTDEFLVHFGIKNLKALPSIEELRQTS
jgi:segregation and condensation protein B